MAKISSKTRLDPQAGQGKSVAPKVAKTPKKRSKWRKMASKAKSRFKNSKIGGKIIARIQQIRAFRARHIHLHRSFRRSYREDYRRPLETPGLLSHAMTTFGTVFRHWRVFLPFILLMTLAYVVAVGLLSEEIYTDVQNSIDETSASLANGQLNNLAKAGLLLISTITTGGFDTGKGEAQNAFMIILFLIMWLVTLYLLRHFFAGDHPKLRDGLYNALTPLISTLAIFIIIFIQAIPLMLLTIAYSAAVETDFLTTPFYALLFFIFAVLILLLSGYLLSSSLIALIAVTTPGMYPMRALFAASDLMAERRLKFILRVIYLLIVVALIYVIIMLPVILLDLWLKSFWDFIVGVPIVPFFLVLSTCFVFIYATAYLYQYYRWLLGYQAPEPVDHSKRTKRANRTKKGAKK